MSAKRKVEAMAAAKSRSDSVINYFVRGARKLGSKPRFLANAWDHNTAEKYAEEYRGMGWKAVVVEGAYSKFRVLRARVVCVRGKWTRYFNADDIAEIGAAMAAAGK